MLTEEQVKSIKEQLLKQVESLPDEQKESAKQQIEAMDAEQLEQFLKQNKLVSEGDGKCIFCAITSGETFSYRIAENKEAIAILDINPVSEGHTLVLPKEHKSIDGIPSALQLAQEVAKTIKEKLSPEDVKIETSSIQGHGIISIIPIYKDKKPERRKAEDKELEAVLKKLKKEPEKKEEKPTKKKVKIEDLPFAPIRIP